MPNFDQSGRAGASPCSCWYDRVVYLRVETFAESAWAFETPRAPTLFLSQCLSQMAENSMIGSTQLPEWQQKRLSRLMQLYTADIVPN
jgi:hypothetical protein